MAAYPPSTNLTPGSGTGLGSSTFTGQLTTNVGGGSQPYPLTSILNSISPCSIQQVDLTAATEKTITVPATSVGVIVLPPAANSANWELRKTTTVADFLKKGGIKIEMWDGTVPSSFFLYCASTVSGFTVIFF